MNPAELLILRGAVPCPDGPHRGPQGPNEDLGQCRLCLMPSYGMRPAGEQFGLHADDCCLPITHPSYCQGGGAGHAPGPTVRGYWPGMDDDVKQAHERHPEHGTATQP